VGGRPRYRPTWLRTLDADLQPHNFGLNLAWKYAQDREHIGRTSWKPLRSSSGHARNDEDGRTLF